LSLRIRFSLVRSGLIAAIALTGALAFPAVTHPVPAVDPPESLRVQSFQVNLLAPPLTLEGVDGQPLRLEDLKGNVALLSFWATWCVPCRQEMPAMERLYRVYRERGLVVVAVNFKESKDEVQRFIGELRLSFPAVLDPDGAAAHIFAVRGLPVTFLLDRHGRILWKAIGSRDWDSPDARAYFKRML
jgi:thiol-disulfide isomerase/thioredoxin